MSKSTKIKIFIIFILFLLSYMLLYTYYKNYKERYVNSIEDFANAFKLNIVDVDVDYELIDYEKEHLDVTFRIEKEDLDKFIGKRNKRRTWDELVEQKALGTKAGNNILDIAQPLKNAIAPDDILFLIMGFSVGGGYSKFSLHKPYNSAFAYVDKSSEDHIFFRIYSCEKNQRFYCNFD